MIENWLFGILVVFFIRNSLFFFRALFRRVIRGLVDCVLCRRKVEGVSEVFD